MTKKKNDYHHNRILLIATTSYAGMGPYVVSVINSFSQDDEITYYLVEREDNYYTHNIKPELKSKGIIIQERTPYKIETLADLLMGGHYPYHDDIIKYCEYKKVNIIHALSSLWDVDLVKELTKRYKLLYTVHDLIPHEASKSFLKMWRQNVFNRRIFNAISHTRYLLTNSQSQLTDQKKIYPNKKSYYSPFPSLVTKEIAEGRMQTPELSGITNYILFFGRFEAYKGIDLLIEAFIKAFLPEIKLVIAGKGDINAPTNSNIIIINRYIDDREIANLYRNAACVVYPYISATQSGVLSISSYFKTPIISSDIPFFKEVLGDHYDWFFRNNDVQDLTEKLQLFFKEKPDLYQEMDQIYSAHYAKNILADKLLDIYAEISNELEK